MANTFDDRLVALSITIQGKTNTYTDLYISASGTKYANENENECEIKIANLTSENRAYLLTQTSPFNDTRIEKTVTLLAGRKSYGLSTIFVGNIVSVTVSQPPDIFVTLRCLTGFFQNGNIIARTQPEISRLSSIASSVAKDLGLTLNFQATDKNVSNYSYSGPALKQVRKLGEVGLLDAYIDNNMLVVKNAGVPLSNTTRVLDLDSGMIGVPQLTELGVKVTFFLDNFTTLGGGLQIKSIINPAANGNYIIYKLSFEIANRDTPFYWIADGLKVTS